MSLGREITVLLPVLKIFLNMLALLSVLTL
jgi:hypothetical protein